MFQIRQAGPKGFGIFASQHIARGTRILTERPLLSITDASPDILAATRNLTLAAQQALLPLSFNFAKRSSPWRFLDATWQSLRSWSRQASTKANIASTFAIRKNRDILNIFYNNNFALADEHNTRALFPTIARLNHSCIPNAQGNFNTNLGRFTIHALRDIVHGDEITISYLQDGGASLEARQKRLRDGYDFDCACEICAENSPKREQSRKRRSRLHGKLAIFAQQNQSAPSSEPGTHASGVRKDKLVLTLLLIDMYEQEGLAGRELASLYSAAAGLAIRLGNHLQGFTLGARGLELERDAVGEDSPFYETRRLDFEGQDFGEENTAKSERLFAKIQEEDAALSYAPWT